jgi:hypothetical protein
MTHPAEHGLIFTFLRAIASSLTFDVTNPFHNSLFVPIFKWVTDEKGLIDRLASKLEDGDLERVWEIVTTKFPRDRRGLKATYLKMVKQTYHYAGFCEPSGGSPKAEPTPTDLVQQKSPEPTS